MWRLLVSVILAFNISHSEAATLRCEIVFSGLPYAKPSLSAPYYARALDDLNQKHQGFLFKTSLTETLQPDLKNLSLLENAKARLRARKVRKLLVELHEFDQKLNIKAPANVYALEKFAVNLEKLTFLMDESVLNNLSFADRAVYKQLQHSLLSQGLSRFLFTKDLDLPKSQVRLIISKIMTPFKRIYLRWLLTPIMVPHLDGSTIPYEVIEHVIWNGYANSKTQLAPYLKTAQGKHHFNVFASTWNTLLAAAIFTSAASWVVTTSVDSYQSYHRGLERAEATLKTSHELAEKLAHKDLSQEFKQDTLKISLDLYRTQYNREPSPREIEMFKQLISSAERED